MYEDTLKQAGLSPGEAEIYEILLNLGTSPAREIVKKTSLKRGTVYNILDELAIKGLITKETRGTKTMFIPVSPNALLDLIAKQEESARQGKRAVADILDNLRSLYVLTQEKPVIRFYEGKQGIIRMYEEVLTLAHKEILSIEDKGEMTTFIPDYFPMFIKKRTQKGLFNRVIAPSQNPINATSQKELRETRRIPSIEFPFSMDIKIFENGVSFVTFQKNTAVGVLIQHPVIAENFTILFEYWWKKLTPPPKIQSALE